jgi:hypothetical protein
MNVARRIASKVGCGATVLVAGLLSSPAGHSPAAAAALPDASEVTRRMIERARGLAAADQGSQYVYDCRSLHEHLDAAGRPIKSEEKFYQVTLIAGIPCNRLVGIRGRELSAEELRREQAKEERFQRRFVAADRKGMAARREALVTPELLGRYEFTVKERAMLNNRSTLVLTFKPRQRNLPSKTVQDKFLSRMGGTLWIDETDCDTARLAVGLVEPLSLGWFGWMGSLIRFDLSLDRQRMPDGVWVSTRMAISIQGRKLATALRFRLTEESSGFRRVESK